MVVHQIVDFTAAFIHIGDGRGSAIAIFRGLAGVEVGVLSVVVSQKAHVVGMGPAKAEGLSCSIRLDGGGIVGAGKGVVDSSTTDSDIGLVVVHVAGDGTDRIDGGRSTNQIIVGQGIEILVGENFVVEQDAGGIRALHQCLHSIHITTACRDRFVGDHEGLGNQPIGDVFA